MIKGTGYSTIVWQVTDSSIVFGSGKEVLKTTEIGTAAEHQEGNQKVCRFVSYER